MASKKSSSKKASKKSSSKKSSSKKASKKSSKKAPSKKGGSKKGRGGKSVISKAVQTIRETASSIGGTVTSYLPGVGTSSGGGNVDTSGGKNE